MTEQNGRHNPDADLLGADADLDAEVGALLSVEPSSHFVSRVRARVADDARQPSRTWWRWLAPVGAIAVIAVAVAWWPERPLETSVPPLAARTVGIPVATTILVEPVGTFARRGSVFATASSTSGIARPRFEVIIDAAESATLQRFVARAGAPLPSRTAAATPAANDPVIANDAIEIRAMADFPPISIEPLTLDEGVAQ